MTRNEEFVWVKLKEGVGSVNFTEGRIHIRIVGPDAQKVLKAAWPLAQRRGLPLELTDPPGREPSFGSAQDKLRTKREKE